MQLPSEQLPPLNPCAQETQASIREDVPLLQTTHCLNLIQSGSPFGMPQLSINRKHKLNVWRFYAQVTPLIIKGEA